MNATDYNNNYLFAARSLDDKTCVGINNPVNVDYCARGGIVCFDYSNYWSQCVIIQNLNIFNASANPGTCVCPKQFCRELKPGTTNIFLCVEMSLVTKRIGKESFSDLCLDA